MFHQQIDKNMKTYVYDLLIKSWTIDSFIDYLKKVFVILQGSRIWLNPKKCVFGVQSRNLSGYMISSRG